MCISLSTSWGECWRRGKGGPRLEITILTHARKWKQTLELKLWRSNGAQRRNKAREIWLQAEVVEEEEEKEEEEEQLQQRCWNCAINCVRAFLLRTCRYKDTFVSWARGRQSKYVLRTASTSISISIRTRTRTPLPPSLSPIPVEGVISRANLGLG